MLKRRTLSRTSFLADRLSYALQLERHPFVGSDNVVARVGDFTLQPCPCHGQADREIAVPHGLQAFKYQREVGAQ
jgi:hypothetical protein